SQGTPERLEQRVQVMTRDDTDIGHPEVLEQLPRLRKVDDRTAKTLAQLEDGRADDRDALDGAVVCAPAVLPCVRQLDLGQVLRERADGRADRHLVVVED